MQAKLTQLIICFFFFSFCLSAQKPSLLKSTGNIPDDFLTPSTVKYKAEVEDLKGKKSDRKTKKDKKRFLLETSFSIDDILQSGMVLFNDPATKYINKVLANLPIEDTYLKGKNPRAYILNSSAVNAFATDQGIIFITLGLLATLENEAQLAFILSHELIHIKHRHSLDKFIESKKIDKKDSQNKKNMEEVNIDRASFSKAMYSQQLETEADDEGIEIFLKSEYDPKAVLNTFNILHYSYLPFENEVFDTAFFQDEYFVFPRQFWRHYLNEISPMKEDSKEAKKSSHPSSSVRFEKLKERVSNSPTNGKTEFILPQKEFFEIQKRARYQIPFLNLYNENFPEAIYTSYLVLKYYPNDYEVRKVIGKALYMELKYQLEEKDRSNDYKENNSDIEGESQQVYHFLNLLTKSEMVILAMKYNWNLHLENKEDQETIFLLEDLSKKFAKQFDSLEYYFSAKPPTPESEVDSTTSETSAYWTYAFVNEMQDPNFKKNYEKGMAAYKKEKASEEYYESEEGEKEIVERIKKERESGKSIGIKKIAVVNPFYISLDARKDETVQLVRSEEKQNYFSNSILKIAKKSEIEIDLLDVTKLSVDESEKFNDIAELNHYFTQQMKHYDFSLSPSFNQNAINAIAEKYGTDYFLWTGVISLREKNKSWRLVALSALFIYPLPLILPYAITPKYDMMYYAILFDVKTGQRSILKMDYFDKRDSKGMLNAHIYDVFYQISND